MTKEEILNGMSEEEFYQLYPTKEAWEAANKMKLGGLSGAPHNGQPTANQFFSYGSRANDQINIPMSNPFYLAYGGGLPGGPHEMPCLECGGMHKAQYGFNSGVNYGSFTVPMQVGGSPEFADFVKKKQQEFIQKTGVGIPEKAKKTGTNPLYYDPFTKGSDVSKYDSTATFAGNPNLAIYYKGNKMIVGPAINTGKAKQEAMMFNRGKMLEQDSQIFPDYTKEFGGAYDPSNAGTFPVLNKGGLAQLIKTAMKQTKKAYGGKTEQGGNQDYKKQYRSTFDNYIKQNTYNAIVDAEQQALMQELQQMPYARNGKMVLDKHGVARTPEYMEQQKQMDTFKGSNMICTAAGCFPKGFFRNFADMYAPTKRSYNWNLGDYPYQMMKSYFPMNEFYGYEFGKKDYDYLRSLGDKGQLTGMKLNYGPLGRVMPRIFGPKSVTYGVADPSQGYYEDNMQVTMPSFMQEEKKGLFKKRKKDQGPYPEAKEDYSVIGPYNQKNYNSALEQGIKQSKVEQLMNPFNDQAQQALDKMRGPYTGEAPGVFYQKEKEQPFGFEKEATFKPAMGAPAIKAYGGLIKAEVGVENPVKLQPEYLPSKDLTDMFSQYADQELKVNMSAAEHLKNPLTGSIYNVKPVTAKRQMYWGDIAKYAPAGFNAIARNIEGIHDRAEEERRLLENMTPGSDRGPFATTMGNRGDYTINQGMLRPDNYVPVQFPGGTYGYSKFGGYVEGDEVELSPEEIAELKAQGYEIEELD